MSLRGVLISSAWTPYAVDIIDREMDGESIAFYLSDSSTNVVGYQQFARSFIGEVDAALDLDFVETVTRENAAIEFYINDWTDANGSLLGLCTLWGSQITAETYVKSGLSLNSNRNTFVHEFGHALGLGEPGWDYRWNQYDTAMSYNPNIYGDYRTSFAPEDWKALISLWGDEDFILVGDSNANALQAQFGELHADSIHGMAGNDVLKGFRGQDTLLGGQGDDRIYGGYGGDYLYGQSDNDTINACRGNDKIYAGRGSDEIYAGRGSDEIYAGRGSDKIYAGRGSDYIDAGFGNDFINGGQGADTIKAGDGEDFVKGGMGSNEIDAGFDNNRDEIYVFADSQVNNVPYDSSFADILKSIDSLDRIYILGSSSSGTLEFSEDESQIKIFYNGAHEITVLGSGLSIDEVRAITFLA